MWGLTGQGKESGLYLKLSKVNEMPGIGGRGKMERKGWGEA